MLFWAAASQSSTTANADQSKVDLSDSARKRPLALYTFVKLVESRSPEFSLSSSEALKYSAQQGDLSSLLNKSLAGGQLEETAVLFQQLVDIVWKRITHYCRCLAAIHGFEIAVDSPAQDAVSVGGEDCAHLRKELEFFVGVFAMVNDSAVRAFDRLFTTAHYDKLDQIVDVLRATLGAIGLSRFIEIPASLKPLLIAEDETSAPTSISATVLKDEKHSLEPLPLDFEKSIPGILSDFKDLNFNLGALRSIEVYAPRIAKLEYIEGMTDGMDAMFKMIDIRVREIFFAAFQKLFVHLPKQFRTEAMQRHYSKRGVENLKKNVPTYDADLNHWSNRIGDHNQFQGAAGQSQLDEMCAHFGWLFLMAPKPTLWNLLTLCMASEAAVPNVIKVLRNLPAVLALTDPQVDDGPMLPVVLSALRRMLSKGVADKPESSDKFLYMASAFARDKRIAKKTLSALGESCEFVTTDEPVVDPSMMISSLVKSELLAERNSLLMLQLLGRLLTGKSAPIRWVADLRQAAVWNGQSDAPTNEAASAIPAESSVEAPKLLLLLLDVYRRNLKTRGGEVSRASLKILKALGERLGLDAIVFSDVTAEWIVGQLNEYDWTVKLLIMEWFAKSFGDRAGRKQIPTCLSKALPADVRNAYEEIECVNHSPVECFLRSVFELAIVGPDYAKLLVDKGFSSIPSHDLLRPALAQTLMDCSDAQPTELMLLHVFPVLKCLVVKLDPSRDHSFLDSISNSTYHGLAQISPLLLFGDATLLSLKNQTSASGSTMLQAYCQLAKEHLDLQMNDLRRSRTVANRPPQNGALADVSTGQMASVSAQLNQIFFQSCQLAKTGGEQEKIPLCLQLLLICLAEYNEEIKKIVSVPLEITAETKDEKTQPASSPKDQLSSHQHTSEIEGVANGLTELAKKQAYQQLNADVVESVSSTSGEMSPSGRSGSNENWHSTHLDKKAIDQSQHNGSQSQTHSKPSNRGRKGVGSFGTEQQNTTSVENALFQTNSQPPVQYSRPPPSYKAPVGNYQQSSSGNLGGHQSRAGNGGQRNSFQAPPPSSRPMQQTNGNLGFGPGNGYKGRGGNSGVQQQRTWSAATSLMEPTTRDLLEAKTVQYQQQTNNQPVDSRNGSTWNGSQSAQNNGGVNSSAQQPQWTGQAKGTRGGTSQRSAWTKRGGSSGGAGGGGGARGGRKY